MVLVSYKPIVLVDRLALVMHFLHTGQERDTLPCTEEPMTTVECLTALFAPVDAPRRALPTHPEARLGPRAVVPLGR